jgi:HEAT repeat protein
MLDLIGVLNDPNAEVRADASAALRSLGQLARPQLLTALSHRDMLVRFGALEALKQSDNGTDEVIPVVVKRLVDKETQVRKKAVEVLGVFRKDCTIPDLIKCLEAGEDREVRVEAAVVLANFHNKAKDACKNLYRAFERGDDDAHVYGWALALIGRDGLPFLIRGLQDEKLTNLYSTIASSIAIMGRDATDAVPVLILRLKTKDKWLLRPLAYALGEIGPNAKQALPELKSAMRNSDMSTKLVIAESLFKIDPNSAEVIPVLASAMKDKDWELRLSAIQAVERIGKPAKEVIPSLLITLKDKEDIVRSWSARAIGAIGAPAVETIRALEQAMEDESATVQDAAREAILDIKRKSRKDR